MGDPFAYAMRIFSKIGVQFSSCESVLIYRVASKDSEREREGKLLVAADFVLQIMILRFGLRSMERKKKTHRTRTNQFDDLYLFR